MPLIRCTRKLLTEIGAQVASSAELAQPACEISRVLSECDPIANGIDLSLLEHVSPIEWDNVVLYGQYILDRKLVRRRRGAKRVVLSV
jgi:hypothetical protein